jgi:hypothetical protein
MSNNVLSFQNKNKNKTKPKGASYMLDKNAIKEAADILIVAEEIGVPIKYRGNKPQILCPCHPDQHFGSAHLDLKDNTFHCYSCGTHGDVFDLVMAHCHTTFSHAKEIIADICGGTALFEKEEDTIKTISRKMIPKDDMEFLGIENNPIYAPIAFVPSYMKEELEQYQNGCYNIVTEYSETDSNGMFDILGYTIEKKIVNNPLYDLLENDENAYRSLIDNFCQKVIDWYIELIKSYHSPVSSWRTEKVVRMLTGDYTYKDFVADISKKAQRVKNISEKYGHGQGSKMIEPIETIRISLTANEVWALDATAPF